MRLDENPICLKAEKEREMDGCQKPLKKQEAQKQREGRVELTDSSSTRRSRRWGRAALEGSGTAEED
jgi:hypothetical protein